MRDEELLAIAQTPRLEVGDKVLCLTREEIASASEHALYTHGMHEYAKRQNGLAKYAREIRHINHETGCLRIHGLLSTWHVNYVRKVESHER